MKCKDLKFQKQLIMGKWIHEGVNFKIKKFLKYDHFIWSNKWGKSCDLTMSHNIIFN